MSEIEKKRKERGCYRSMERKVYEEDARGVQRDDEMMLPFSLYAVMNLTGGPDTLNYLM